MATRNRTRSRRGTAREGGTYVAPVLDPNWHSPYEPSAGERHANAVALRRYAVRRKTPAAVVVGIAVVVLFALFSVSWWFPILGVALGALYTWDLRRSVVRIERQGQRLGPLLRESLREAGTHADRARLDTLIERLGPTFGLSDVKGVVAEDPVYNAALVPDPSGWSLFVTLGALHELDLVELEGMIAHVMARHRLGQLGRQSAAAVAVNLSAEARRELSGPGSAYRADEVAAAAIRYPLGLAGALRRCATQSVPADSFFAGEVYAATCGVWFNRASGRGPDVSELDDVTLRAASLEEW